MKTYKIHEENLWKLNQEITRMNRKAKKLGVAEVFTKVNGVEIHKKKEQGPFGEYTVDKRIYLIEVQGVAPKLPGYSFLGTLEHTEHGNIVRAIPGVELDISFRTVKPKCDHCQKVRSRKDTYVVRHDESGRVLQVGHNCVADFLGGVSPEALALAAEYLKELERLEGEEDEGLGSSGRGSLQIYLPVYLAYVAELISQFGWVSASAAKAYAEKSGGEKQIEPTSRRAMTHMYPDDSLLRQGFVPVTPSEQSHEIARNAIEWAKSLKDSAKSDYEYNLSVAAHHEFIEFRDLGIAASAVSAYQREVTKQLKLAEREKSMAEIAARSGYQGTVGERKEFSLKVNKIITLAPSEFSRFGDDNRFLYSMEDEQGNVFVWFASSKAFIYTMSEMESQQSIATRNTLCDSVDVQEGDKILVKGTVKKHEEYKGIKQTILTRCKVQSIAGQEEGAKRYVETDKALRKMYNAERKAEEKAAAAAAQANEKEAS